MAFAEVHMFIAMFFAIGIGITSLNIFTFLLASCLLIIIGVVQGLITGLLFAELYNLISKYHPSMCFKVE